MLSKDLQSIGFSKNLAEVYLTLAQLGGEAKAGAIIKKLGLHRNIVYVCLEKLINKKLITKVETKGVAVYKTLDAMRLMNEIRQQENTAKNIIEEINALKQHPNTQEVIVHEGLEGFRSYNMQTLKEINEGGLLYILGSFGDKWYQYMGEKKYQEYLKLQSEKKIVWKMISYYDSERDKKLVSDTPLCIRKQFPQTYYNPANTHIFNDTIAFQISAEPFSVIEIKNKALAEVYRNYFDLLWNNNTWTLHGERGAKTWMDDTLNYSDVYFIGGNGGMEKFFPKVWDEYKHQRIKKKVFWHDLITPGMELSGAKKGKTIYDEPYYEYKFLPDTVINPHVICLYGDKMASIVWKEDAVINIIEDKEVVDGYKKYFEFLWNQEVYTYHGWKEIDRVMRSNLEENYTHDIYGANYGNDPQEAMDFYIEYHKKTAYLKPDKRIIFFEKDREINAAKEVSALDSVTRQHTKTRFVDDKYYSPMETHVFEDKVILTFLFDEPVATVYTNPSIVASYKKQFEFWWNMAKE